MSILDDAIREHLELKRAHGADDSEVQRLEDEAFGPPQRPDEIDPFAEAPTEFLVSPGDTPADLPELGDGDVFRLYESFEDIGWQPGMTLHQLAPDADDMHQREQPRLAEILFFRAAEIGEQARNVGRATVEARRRAWPDDAVMGRC